MAKKKINELDPATLTLDRIIAHANPITGKGNRAPVSELISLLTAQTPVNTYADETALLANTDIAIGYLAYVADSDSLYLYAGPTRSDIANYTLLVGDQYTWPFPQVTATGTNTYAATPSPAITAYATGQKFQIKFTNASSGVSTLNLAAIGAKKIFVNPTTQATTSHIVAGQISLLVYDAALDSAVGGFLMIGAPTVGGGTVTSVTGTSNRITSTGGATPVIDIDAAYDAIIAAKAPLASPTFTGTPAAPTAGPGTDTTQVATTAFVHDEVVGVEDLFYPAGGMRPRNTNGCSVATQIEMATSLVNLVVLAFDQTTQEFAQFDIVPPRKYNNGTITATPVWTAQSGTGTVQFGVSFGSYRNDDALTVALGSAQTSDDTLLATNDFHESPDTSAITPSGTIQDGNFLVCQISRNPANDTLNADALLIGLWLHFTTDAAKDA